MMKYFIYILLIGFAVGCSDGLVDVESNDIEGRVSDSSLHVYNKKNDTIWYFAVERETAASILWAPKSSEGNGIESQKTGSILLKDIFGYESGDEIIFYYWSVREPESEDINNIVIKTD